MQAFEDLAAVAAADADEPRMLLIRAELHLTLGSPDLAVADLDRRIAQAPASAPAHELRGQLRSGAGDAAGALAAAEAAWQAGPTLDRTVVLARRLEAAGKPEAAADACIDGADRFGGAVVLRLDAAARLQGLGRYDDALTQVDLLLAASPEHPDWLVLRADVLLAAGRPASRPSSGSTNSSLYAPPRCPNRPRSGESGGTDRLCVQHCHTRTRGVPG